MTNVTTITPKTETLSQSELFQRYLDAPVRVGATTSTLVLDDGKMRETTARERFLYQGACLLGSIHDDFAEDILEFAENDEFPAFELEKFIRQLSELLEALNVLSQDFDRLAEITRTEEPDEDAPEEDFDDWDKNPRYVLPVIEPREAA